MATVFIESFVASVNGGQTTGLQMEIDTATGRLFTANRNDGVVYEFRLSDGSPMQVNGTPGTLAQATYTLPANTYAYFVYPTANYLWVAGQGKLNPFQPSIFRFRRSDRVLDVTVNHVYGFANVQANFGILSMGGYLWTMMIGTGTRLIRFDPVTGGYTYFAVGTDTANLKGMATDGTYLYVLGGSADLGYVRKVDVNGTTVLSAQPAGPTTSILGPSCDGNGNLYFTNSSTPPTLYKVRTSDLALLASVAVPASMFGFTADVTYHDGGNLWGGTGQGAYNTPGLFRTAIDYSQFVDTLLTGGGTASIRFDGTYLWWHRGGAVPCQISRLRVASPAPTLTNASAYANGIHLNFDNTINAGTPTVGGVANQMQVTSASQNGGSGIDLAVTALPDPPQLTIAKSSGTGVLVGFDRPVVIGVGPDYGTMTNNLQVTGAAQSGANAIQLSTSITVIAGLTLLSAVASDGQIALTFDGNASLTLAGQDPASYTITTTTPGAVIPTITSITAVGPVVTIYTSEQTNGASYTVAILPGCIYKA